MEPMANALAIAIEHHQAGRLVQAEQLYREVLQQQPNHVEALHRLGVIASQIGKHEKAIPFYQKVLTLVPNFAEAHFNLASALQNQDRIEEAIAHYQQGLALQPNYPEVHLNLGAAFKAQGRLEKAIAHYQQAITLKPNYPKAHYNLALALLQHGDLPQGFAEYEWRWQLPHNPPRDFSQPLWDGLDLQGRRILIHAEQGLGDTIQFIRYAPLVAQRGGYVIAECQAPLVQLLATVPGINQLVTQGATLPHFDVHAPLLSLPHLFGTTLETIPAQFPYISPPESDKLKLEVPPGTTLKVGIAWAGSPKNPNNRHRSLDVSYFLALLDIPGVAFYSLQKEPPAAELTQLGDRKEQVQDLSKQLQDFTDTAEIVEQLDLVITVDTSIAHLAGALGKSVWVLLNFDPDWRWLIGREDSPWYPSVRLFRQESPGNWHNVFVQVAQSLFAFVADTKLSSKTVDTGDTEDKGE
jgi:thioredoxin-like negative regulator of GroEL